MEFIRFPFPWNQTLYYNLFAISQNSLACIPIHAQNIDDNPDKLYYMVFRFAMDFIFCPLFLCFLSSSNRLASPMAHGSWHRHRIHTFFCLLRRRTASRSRSIFQETPVGPVQTDCVPTVRFRHRGFHAQPPLHDVCPVPFADRLSLKVVTFALIVRLLSPDSR